MFIITYFCFGCKSQTKLDKNNWELFSPVLKEKLVEYISYINSKRPYRSKKDFFYITFRERNDEMFLLIGTDFFYDKNKDKGYVFMNDELVVYRGNHSNRKQYLVDTTKLIPLVDTIPNYWSVDDGINMDYEVYRREFVIQGNDSLTWVGDFF